MVTAVMGRRFGRSRRSVFFQSWRDRAILLTAQTVDA
jgi:hypothetical protein